MPLILDNRSVSRQDDRPLHSQLAAVIRDAIIRGDLPPGAALPSEREMTTATGVSRTAVRQAIDTLAAESRIVRRKGSPTRVATPPPIRHMTSSRYRDELTTIRGLREGESHPLISAFTSDQGITWREFTVEATYITDTATKLDGDRLHLLIGEPVLRRHLVKYAAGEPVQIQDSVIPLAFVEGTPVMDPERQPWPGGTLAELDSVGLVPTRVREEATTAMATAEERRVLAMETSGPVWHILRVFYVGDNPVEASVATCQGDRVALIYETELS